MRGFAGRIAGVRAWMVVTVLAGVVGGPAPAMASEPLRVGTPTGRSWDDVVHQIQTMSGRTDIDVAIVVTDATGARLLCGEYILHLDADGARAFEVGSCDPVNNATTLSLRDRAPLFIPATPVPRPRSIVLTAERVARAAPSTTRPEQINVSVDVECRDERAPRFTVSAINPIDGSNIPLVSSQYVLACPGHTLIAEGDGWTTAPDTIRATVVNCEIRRVGSTDVVASTDVNVTCARPPTQEELAAQREQERLTRERESAAAAAERQRQESARRAQRIADRQAYHYRIGARFGWSTVFGAAGLGAGSVLGLGFYAFMYGYAAINGSSIPGCFGGWHIECTRAMEIGGMVGMIVLAAFGPLIPSPMRVNSRWAIPMVISNAVVSGIAWAAALVTGRDEYLLAGAMAMPLLASIFGTVADHPGASASFGAAQGPTTRRIAERPQLVPSATPVMYGNSVVGMTVGVTALTF